MRGLVHPHPHDTLITMVEVPPTDVHRSISGGTHLRRFTPASLGMEATVNQMMQINNQWTRKLTVILMDCSKALIVDGGDDTIKDSDDHRGKGTSRWRRFGAPFFDSSLEDDQQNQALLLDQRSCAGVVLIGG
jgi:hypothetical protein